MSELGVSSICTCNYLYEHVHVCKGFNESKIVLYCYLLLSITCIMVTCTCKYLYEHVHVCKGFNESKIVLHCHLLLLR